MIITVPALREMDQAMPVASGHTCNLNTCNYSSVFWESTPVTHTHVGSCSSNLVPVPSLGPSPWVPWDIHTPFLQILVPLGCLPELPWGLLRCAPATPGALCCNYLIICLDALLYVSPRRRGSTSVFSSLYSPSAEWGKHLLNERIMLCPHKKD